MKRVPMVFASGLIGLLVTGPLVSQEPKAKPGVQPNRVESRLGDTGASPGSVGENPKDGIKYVWIPPGTFMMGCSPGDSECCDEEKPAHQVRITKGFWIGQTEVTVTAWKRFAAASGRGLPLSLEAHPDWAELNRHVQQTQPV